MRLVGTHNRPPTPGVLPERNTGRRRAATSSPQRHTPAADHIGLTPTPTPTPAPRPAPAARAFPADTTFNPAGAFAALAAGRIEGGRAAIVRPAARQGLMRAAAAAGLRPFDATLIIAMVQDRARRGEPLAESARDPRLVAVKQPRRGLPLAQLAPAAVTVCLAASMFALMLTWLAGA